MTQKCPVDGCLSLHPSEHSLAMHLYKMGDDDHDEWDDYDATLRETFTSDYSLESGEAPAQPQPETDADGSEPSVAEPSETDPSPSTARTDGGAMPVPDEWGRDDDDDGDEFEDEPDGCPECGSAKYFDPAELPDRVLEEAPALEDHDRACMPCSTTPDGDLAETVEVYDV